MGRVSSRAAKKQELSLERIGMTLDSWYPRPMKAELESIGHRAPRLCGLAELFELCECRGTPRGSPQSRLRKSGMGNSELGTWNLEPETGRPDP